MNNLLYLLFCFVFFIYFLKVSNAQLQQITPLDLSSGDDFGFSSSIHLDTIVVGAIGTNSSSGAAYVFKKNETTNQFYEHSKLTTDSPAGEFGYSVDVFEDLLIIGAHYDSTTLPSAGSAFIYRFDSQTAEWNQTTKLQPPDLSISDEFGYSCGIAEHFAVVGAPYQDQNTTTFFEDSGAVYVYYELSLNNWTLDTKLLPSEVQAEANFGFACAIHDLTILVGVPGDTGSGSVYLFERTNSSQIGTWIQIAYLLPQNSTGGDLFGFSVALVNSLAVVGAPLNDRSTNVQNSGSIYVLEKLAGETWQQTTQLFTPDSEEFDELGSSCGVSENGWIVAGAQGTDQPLSASGSVYVYKLHGNGTWAFNEKITNSPSNVNAYLGSSTDVSASGIAVLGAYGRSAGGASYVIDLTANEPPVIPSLEPTLAPDAITTPPTSVVPITVPPTTSAPTTSIPTTAVPTIPPEYLEFQIVGYLADGGRVEGVMDIEVNTWTLGEYSIRTSGGDTMQFVEVMYEDDNDGEGSFTGRKTFVFTVNEIFGESIRTLRVELDRIVTDEICQIYRKSSSAIANVELFPCQLCPFRTISYLSVRSFCPPTTSSPTTQSPTPPPTAPIVDAIPDVLENATQVGNFSVFLDVLASEGVEVLLRDGYQFFTVFAPPNPAWQNFTRDVTDTTLLYHIVSSAIEWELIEGEILVDSEAFLPSLNDEAQKIKIGVEADGNGTQRFWVNGIEIGEQINATNGEIFVVNEVLELPLNMVDVVEDFGDELEFVLAFLNRSEEIFGVVSEGKGITFFAPNSDSFWDLPEITLEWLGSRVDLASEDLMQIMQNHIITEGVYYSDEFPLNSTWSVTSMIGENIEVLKVDPETIELNGESMIISKDNLAANGVLHVIDKVLLPKSFALTVPKMIKVFEYDTFYSLLEQSGVLDELNNNNRLFTVLIPPDSALSTLDTSPSTLARTLRYHVIIGNLTKEDILQQMNITTLLDELIIIDNGLLYDSNNHSFTLEDPKNGSLSALSCCSNGLIWELSGVLDPPEPPPTTTPPVTTVPPTTATTPPTQPPPQSPPTTSPTSSGGMLKVKGFYLFLSIIVIVTLIFLQ